MKNKELINYLKTLDPEATVKFRYEYDAIDVIESHIDKILMEECTHTILLTDMDRVENYQELVNK